MEALVDEEFYNTEKSWDLELAQKGENPQIVSQAHAGSFRQDQPVMPSHIDFDNVCYCSLKWSILIIHYTEGDMQIILQ